MFNIHRASTYLPKAPRAKVSVVRGNLKADPERDSFMTFITSNVSCKGVFFFKEIKSTVSCQYCSWRFMRENNVFPVGLNLINSVLFQWTRNGNEDKSFFFKYIKQRFFFVRVYFEDFRRLDAIFI